MEAETSAMNLFPWFYLWCGVGLKCKMYPIKDCPNPVKSFHSDKGKCEEEEEVYQHSSQPTLYLHNLYTISATSHSEWQGMTPYTEIDSSINEAISGCITQNDTRLLSKSPHNMQCETGILGS